MNRIIQNVMGGFSSNLIRGKLIRLWKGGEWIKFGNVWIRVMNSTVVD